MTEPFPRDEWLAALYAYGPRGAPRRAVARVFADFAKGEQTWATVPKICQRTGLGERTVYYALHGRPESPARDGRRAERALPGLIELGWLTPVSKRAQHYSPRYRLTIPARPDLPERQDPDLPERRPDLPERQARPAGAAARPAGAAARPAGAAPDFHHTPATPPPPAAQVTPEELAAAVVVVVEKAGIKGTDQRLLAHAARALPELGWTPELITDAARARDWTGARGGAVSAWLRQLGAPPPPMVRTPTKVERCEIHRLELPCRGCAADRLAGQ